MALEIFDLTVSYGRLLAVRNVSLSVSAGSGLGVVGRNGAGKTTLLRGITNSFDVKATGVVSVDGVTFDETPADSIARSGVAFVPAERHIFPFAVRDNFRLAARGRVGWEEEMERLLDVFGVLRPKLDQKGDTLSGGEQQALAIARAAIMKPRYMLLDEPTEGLAPVVVDSLTEALQELAAASNVGFIVVDRNLDFLEAICSSVCVLEKGEVVFRHAGRLFDVRSTLSDAMAVNSATKSLLA